MKDSRIIKLANNILTYSINIQKGEKLLIDIMGEDSMPLAKELVKQAYKLGAYPYTTITNFELTRLLLEEIPL